MEDRSRRRSSAGSAAGRRLRCLLALAGDYLKYLFMKRRRLMHRVARRTLALVHRYHGDRGKQGHYLMEHEFSCADSPSPAFLAAHARLRPLEIIVQRHGVSGAQLDTIPLPTLDETRRRCLQVRYPEYTGPPEPCWRGYSLIGSCEGLLLFERGVGIDHFVCNPITRRWTMLPRHSSLVWYRYSWSELDSLGGRMLFVGRGCSRSYETADYPGFKDGIYFSDDRSFYDEQIMFRGVDERQYPCSDTGKWTQGPPPNVERFFPEQGPSNHSSPAWLLP